MGMTLGTSVDTEWGLGRDAREVIMEQELLGSKLASEVDLWDTNSEAELNKLLREINRALWPTIDSYNTCENNTSFASYIQVNPTHRYSSLPSS